MNAKRIMKPRKFLVSFSTPTRILSYRCVKVYKEDMVKKAFNKLKPDVTPIAIIEILPRKM